MIKPYYETENGKLYHGSCLEQYSVITNKSVGLILTDLPYGTMNGAGLDGWGKNKMIWDFAIDPKKIFKIANCTLRKNGKLILFSQEPYTTKLITEAISNISFSYRLIWEKDHFANSLIAKKAPVSYFEDILAFSKIHELNTDNEVRDYLVEERQKVKEAGYTDKQLRIMCGRSLKGGGLLCHYWGREQWMMPTKKHYDTLQQTGYFQKPYQDLRIINNQLKKEVESTFNLWEGNKYKSNILKYKKDYNGYHPTQKPILLIEDLIKTFSNESDLVVDFCCGSGTTGVACEKLNRKWIMIEKEEKYCEIAAKRIEQERSQLKLW